MTVFRPSDCRVIPISSMLASRRAMPGKLSLYGYFLDFDNAVALSSRTLGLRFAGNRAFDALNLSYAVEFANQKEYGKRSQEFSANYYLAELGVDFSQFGVKVGYEVLEGNATTSGKAFTTPLATLHKFQGWADKFLATPAGGIEDTYVTLSAARLGANVNLTYHQFDTNNGGADYGSEIDFSITKKLTDHVSVLFKYASYDADSLSTDTDKAWLMLFADF